MFSGHLLNIYEELAFHLTCKTGLANNASVAVNGKRVAGWQFWYEDIFWIREKKNIDKI